MQHAPVRKIQKMSYRFSPMLLFALFGLYLLGSNNFNTSLAFYPGSVDIFIMFSSDSVSWTDVSLYFLSDSVAFGLSWFHMLALDP